MRSTIALLAALAAPLTVAAADKPQTALEVIPVHANDGRNGFSHVQFAVPCEKCFRADPSKPKSRLIDGFLQFDVRITRHLGLDGDDAVQVNGYTVEDEEFPFIDIGETRKGNVNTAIQLLAPTRYDSAGQPVEGPYSVGLRGNLSLTTLVQNGTYDVKGVVFNVTGVEASSGEASHVVPEALTGFRLSYSRRPKNSILRFQQGAAPTTADPYPFADADNWIAPQQDLHFAWAAKHLEFVDKKHTIYPGWDQAFVQCKTIPCRVNKLHTRFSKVYDACVEAHEEGQSISLRCHAYMLPYYAKRNVMWVGCIFAGVLSTLMRFLLQAKKDSDQAKKDAVKEKERILDALEDDACDYLMRTEGVADAGDVDVPAGALEGDDEKEGVEARRAYTADEL